MKKFKMILSNLVPVLCFGTSLLIILQMFNVINKTWLVFVICSLTFIVSLLNLVFKIREIQK